MTRSYEATGKTVDEARLEACAKLGVSEYDENVSYEVLAMPQKTGFLGLKFSPARVKVVVEVPDVPATAEPVGEVEREEVVTEVSEVVSVEAEVETGKITEEAVISVTEVETPTEISERVVVAPAEETEEERPLPAEEIEETEEKETVQENGEDTEVPIVIEENAKVKAAVEYLREVIGCMGVKDVEFTAVQKGEATIIRLDGEHMGVLIGRRGETMESLSYLASLVANRLEGDYIKLGLDVAGYRGKREQDLTALAERIGAKVRKTGRSFAMEPMNPYERRIIHSAIGKMEGLRSESKGEGRDRRVVIYSTAPGAQTENTYGERHPHMGGYRGQNSVRSGASERTERRPRFNRNGERNNEERGERPVRQGGYRGGNRNGAGRSNYRAGNRTPRPSNVPERTYVPRDVENAAPVAPKRTERVDDFADFSFGKIEL